MRTAKKKSKKTSGRESSGRFSVGNTLGVGRTPKYTLKALGEACEDYFNWADLNPIKKNEYVRSGEGAGTPFTVEFPRPYTLTALCHHIGLSLQGWRDYENRDGFIDITTRVREKIDNQQFEGAMVGIFHANLTARRLGLAQKNEHVGGDPSKPIHSQVVSKVVIEDYTSSDGS